ncbi:hypothetical protein [Mucilaginibacter paludis]|uniref:6,7-dimethyl-8-ribityllumazine synthase n=1 Tax=Mucilaginibacter paludis DSM 18603 TaxID=714943 RepID=H1YGD1_9SPHI|nr:hypothetical protein [Mucilaginibacter paludis]EHQ24483.1 6,7-dimethyl-8-ribityllumazine synthase [Mucilaginibacter paludis DSM 18603]
MFEYKFKKQFNYTTMLATINNNIDPDEDYLTEEEDFDLDEGSDFEVEDDLDELDPDDEDLKGEPLFDDLDDVEDEDED